MRILLSFHLFRIITQLIILWTIFLLFSEQYDQKIFYKLLRLLLHHFLYTCLHTTFLFSLVDVYRSEKAVPRVQIRSRFHNMAPLIFIEYLYERIGISELFHMYVHIVHTYADGLFPFIYLFLPLSIRSFSKSFSLC